MRDICFYSKLTATSYLFFLIILNIVFLLSSVDFKMFTVYLSHYFIKF